LFFLYIIYKSILNLRQYFLVFTFMNTIKCVSPSIIVLKRPCTGDEWWQTNYFPYLLNRFPVMGLCLFLFWVLLLLICYGETIVLYECIFSIVICFYCLFFYWCLWYLIFFYWWYSTVFSSLHNISATIISKKKIKCNH